MLSSEATFQHLQKGSITHSGWVRNGPFSYCPLDVGDAEDHTTCCLLPPVSTGKRSPSFTALREHEKPFGSSCFCSHRDLFQFLLNLDQECSLFNLQTSNLCRIGAALYPLGEKMLCKWKVLPFRTAPGVETMSKSSGKGKPRAEKCMPGCGLERG